MLCCGRLQAQLLLLCIRMGAKSDAMQLVNAKANCVCMAYNMKVVACHALHATIHARITQVCAAAAFAAAPAGMQPSGITRQLFIDDRDYFVGDFLAYNVEEFVQTWPLPQEAREQLQKQLDVVPTVTVTVDAVGLIA